MAVERHCCYCKGYLLTLAVYVNVQLGGPDNVAEITGRRGMLVRTSCGKGVTYQARNT